MCNYFFTLAMARKLEAFIIEPRGGRKGMRNKIVHERSSPLEERCFMSLSQLTAPLRALIDQGVIIPYR